MAKEQIELRADWDARSKAYLFKEPGNGNYATNCMISAHGWYSSGTTTYTPAQGITLHFYVPHGATVDDLNNCREALIGGLQVVESVSNPRSCTDYRLSKLQVPKSTIEGQAREKGWTFDEAAEAIGLFGETYGSLKQVDNTTFDIATVRNRALDSTLSLSKLISAIEREHHYANYYCAFCRVLK